MKPTSQGRSFRSRIFLSFLAIVLPVLVLVGILIETFLVPYVVATYGAVSARRAQLFEARGGD